MPHPDEGLIHAWLDGELDQAEADRVESLVARDPQWAAAAAEARGLIAASSRIAGALDGLSGKTTRRARPQRRLSPAWLTGVAALLLVVASATTVLRRKPPELPRPATNDSIAAVTKSPGAAIPQSAAALAQAPAKAKDTPGVRRTEGRRTEAPTPAAAARSDLAKSADEPKAAGSLADRNLAWRGERRAAMGGAPATAPGAAGSAAREQAAQAQASPPAARAMDKVESFRSLPPRCFEVRQPPEPVARIISLSPAALADSVRLSGFVIRGDSLLHISRGFVAVTAPCPLR